jgi:hypothetical protein
LLEAAQSHGPEAAQPIGCNPRYRVLFEPVKIGPVTAPNRFYQVPHASGMTNALPRVQAKFRETKAEGGGEWCAPRLFDPSEFRRFAFAFRAPLGRQRHLLACAYHRGGARSEDVFENFSYLTEDNHGLEGNLASIGPAPDFKAEVFLEDGLSIDDVEGLTGADRDRVKGRFEKKQKLAARADRES